jgi:hypothetical protein
MIWNTKIFYWGIPFPYPNHVLISEDHYDHRIILEERMQGLRYQYNDTLRRLNDDIY